MPNRREFAIVLTIASTLLTACGASGTPPCSPEGLTVNRTPISQSDIFNGLEARDATGKLQTCTAEGWREADRQVSPSKPEPTPIMKSTTITQEKPTAIKPENSQTSGICDTSKTDCTVICPNEYKEKIHLKSQAPALIDLDAMRAEISPACKKSTGNYKEISVLFVDGPVYFLTEPVCGQAADFLFTGGLAPLLVSANDTPYNGCTVKNPSRTVIKELEHALFNSINEGGSHRDMNYAGRIFYRKK